MCEAFNFGLIAGELRILARLMGRTPHELDDAQGTHVTINEDAHGPTDGDPGGSTAGVPVVGSAAQSAPAGSEEARARYDALFGDTAASTFADPNYVWGEMNGAPYDPT